MDFLGRQPGRVLERLPNVGLLEVWLVGKVAADQSVQGDASTAGGMRIRGPVRMANA